MCARVCALAYVCVCAVSRGGRFGAAEPRLLLGDASCRADPAAALAFGPLLALARGLRWGLVPPALAVELFAGPPARVGPAFACKRALAALGLGADPLAWTLPPWPELPAGPWLPQSEPLEATRRLLCLLWRGQALRAVAARRAEFALLARGVDWHASLLALGHRVACVPLERPRPCLPGLRGRGGTVAPVLALPGAGRGAPGGRGGVWVGP